MIRSYREIKNHIDGHNIMISEIKKHYNGIIPKEIAQYINEQEKQFKLDCREFYRHICKWHKDFLSVPIRNDKQWRTVSDDNGETCTDFIILPNDGQTDEDIEQFVYDTVYCPSYYDFPTGRMITLHWSFKRIPCGIAIIHERGIDW